MHAFDDESVTTAKAAGDHQHPCSPGSAPLSGGPTTAQHLLHMQRAVGNAGVVQLLKDEQDPHGLQRLLGSGGTALDSKTRASMEGAFNTDFSDVRVHTGSEADRSAKSLGAHAYTAGSNVVFGAGAFDPDSVVGQRTLAHELTHVVQQRSGPVDGTQTSTGVKLSDPSDRFEQAAEANAERIVAAQTIRSAGGSPPPALPLQRNTDGEEVQGLFVQREAAGEEAAEEKEEEVQGSFVQRQEDAEEESAE